LGLCLPCWRSTPEQRAAKAAANARYRSTPMGYAVTAACQIAWRAKHTAEKLAARAIASSAWRADHPGYNVAKAAFFRGRTYGHNDWVEPEVFVALLERPCFDCGGEATQVDHILAFADGGRNVEENLQPSCRPCNRRKETAARRARRQSAALAA
jgi:hypothetical protein